MNDTESNSTEIPNTSDSQRVGVDDRRIVRLFVGGVADGRRIAIPAETARVKIPREDGGVDEYRNDALQGCAVDFFVIEGLDANTMTAMLLEHYQPNAQSLPPADE